MIYKRRRYFYHVCFQTSLRYGGTGTGDLTAETKLPVMTRVSLNDIRSMVMSQVEDATGVTIISVTPIAH